MQKDKALGHQIYAIIGFSHLSRPARLRSSTTKTKSMMSSLWPLYPSIRLSPRHFNSMLAQVLLWDEGGKLGRCKRTEIKQCCCCCCCCCCWWWWWWCGGCCCCCCCYCAGFCRCCLFFNIHIISKDPWFVQSWTWVDLPLLTWMTRTGGCHFGYIDLPPFTIKSSKTLI